MQWWFVFSRCQRPGLIVESTLTLTTWASATSIRSHCCRRLLTVCRTSRARCPHLLVSSLICIAYCVLAPKNSPVLLQFFHHHHHRHRVARPWQDIAVFTSFRHLERSCARFHAELRRKFCCCAVFCNNDNNSKFCDDAAFQCYLLQFILSVANCVDWILYTFSVNFFAFIMLYGWSINGEPALWMFAQSLLCER